MRRHTIMLFFVAVLTLSLVVDASAQTRTRIYYEDGTWADVITDNSGTRIQDSAGNIASQTGDSSSTGHQNMIDDQRKGGDVVKTIPQ